jgi:hypothetical protein
MSQQAQHNNPLQQVLAG